MSKHKKQKRQASKSGKNRTPISGHKHVNHQLQPPFISSMGDSMQLTSWMNDRLPEMLWASLILASVDRNYALGQFRRILNFIAKHEQKDKLSNLTHSAIAKLDDNLRIELIRFIVEPPETANALVVLRLFDSLPAGEVWRQALPMADPDMDLLMNAVGNSLWHQSQEATDCRWLRVMGQVVCGRFQIPSDMAKEWLNYPHEGDQRAVRPSIRSAELVQDCFDPPDLTWPTQFWQEAWKNTPCLRLVVPLKEPPIKSCITRQSIVDLSDQLKFHWEKTHCTTSIDPKHDGIFGIAFYCLRVLDEMLGIGIGESILGRLGLRTILEARINLAYLTVEDNADLWKKWRTYGSGQAKLNALKFDDSLNPPKHINIESIEQIAGEDIWEEFLTINLASWSNMDLRKLSERAGLKEIYDRHYSWTSGYSHGMWGPIRESCYQTCGNPLHRLHRYPEQRPLGDTVEDATVLMDEILQHLDDTYPLFKSRLMQ